MIAFLLALSRRHDPWYPFAEDGMIFYEQARVLGLGSLFLPYFGYLHLALRILALPLSLFPPSLMPFAFVSTALAIQAGIATYICSDEISNLVPSQFSRGLLAFIYIGLPDIDEAYGHFVNSQWHLAILSILLIFGRAAATRIGTVVRLSLVAVLSLTGPFVAFLLPPIAFELYRSRNRYNLGLFLCSLPSIVQIYLAFHSGRATKPWAFLLRPLLFPRIIGGRGLFSAAIAPRLYWAYYVDAPVLWAATFGVVVLCAYAVVKRNWLGVLLIYLGGCILLASLRAGIIGNVNDLVNPHLSNRYFFILGFGLLTAIVLMVASEKRNVRVVTVGCVAAVLSLSWALPYPVDFWPKYEAALQRYDQAKSGTRVVFPEIPKDWTYEITKR